MLLRLLTKAPTRLANVSEGCSRMHGRGPGGTYVDIHREGYSAWMRYVLVVKDVDVKEEE